MILPTPPSQLTDEELPQEAPPAYDDVQPATAESSSVPREKSAPSPSIPCPQPPDSPPASAVSSKSPISPGKSVWAWIPSPSRARAAAEVKTTIIGLLKELVKRGETGPPARSILDSCDSVCRAYGLSLSAVLQDRCIEGHSALYWAVLKRPKGIPLPNNSPTDVLSAFLAFAAPLAPAALSETRLACLQNADQVLFQQLRQSPYFAPRIGKEEMLLDPDTPRDEVYVEDIASSDAFAVRFHIPLFQQRLRVSKLIDLEFIARGRLWSFKFLIASADNHKLRPIAEPGTWVVTLSLLDHSAPTPVDSRLVIQDASPQPEPSPSGQSPLRRVRHAERKPPIELRLKTGGAEELRPHAYDSLIAASFKKCPTADRLQYDGSPYISSDGTLDATLEAQLGKSDVECVVC